MTAASPVQGTVQRLSTFPAHSPERELIPFTYKAAGTTVLDHELCPKKIYLPIALWVFFAGAVIPDI